MALKETMEKLRRDATIVSSIVRQARDKIEASEAKLALGDRARFADDVKSACKLARVALNEANDLVRELQRAGEE